MSSRIVIGATLSLALAGATSASDVRLRGGQWEMRTEVSRISAPGLPARVAEMMMTQPSTATRCISAREANSADAGLFTVNRDPNCSAEGVSVVGGKVRGKIACKRADGAGRMTTTVSGRLAPDRYDLETRMKSEGAGAPITIESRTTGRRIGDCPAGAEPVERCTPPSPSTPTTSAAGVNITMAC